MTYSFTIETAPAEDDIAYLVQQYDALRPTVDERDTVQLGCFLRDESGRLRAGVYGLIRAGWLYVDVLWVHERLRGLDYGTKLLRSIEQAAVARGVNRAFLATADFQARPFYEKLGYTVFASAQGKRVGATSYLLKHENIAPLALGAKFVLDSPPSAEDVREIDAYLRAFNDQYRSDMPRGTTAVLMRDSSGRLVGGYVGDLSAYAIVLRALWVEDALRGQGYEEQLLAMAEQTALAQGNEHSLADSLTPEFTTFLQGQGYAVGGIQHDYPAGYDTAYLGKRLI